MGVHSPTVNRVGRTIATPKIAIAEAMCSQMDLGSPTTPDTSTTNPSVYSFTRERETEDLDRCSEYHTFSPYRSINTTPTPNSAASPNDAFRSAEDYETVVRVYHA